MINTFPKSPSPDPPPTATSQRSNVGHPTSNWQHNSSAWCSPSRSGARAGGYAKGCDTRTGAGAAAPPFDWVFTRGKDGERESLGRTTVAGAAKACVISNSDAGAAIEWRARMVCGLLLGAPAPVRERSVPSDASAARGGSETVPLGECALMVANAGNASEVRRLGRMEDGAYGGTVRLLARLRPLIGDGGRVVGLASVSWGCWTSSTRRIGQRCTRRKKPCPPKKNIEILYASRR